MELGKRILSTYLPFDVKIQGNTHGQIETLCGIKGETVFIESSRSLYPWADIFEIKLILRPLSDMKDEELSIFYGLTSVDLELINIEEWKEELFNMVKHGDKFTFQQFQKLLEWHFDIFGLIEKCLAIDINTLENGK